MSCGGLEGSDTNKWLYVEPKTLKPETLDFSLRKHKGAVFL